MIETHPFGNFIPSKTKYLLLGSFAGRAASYAGSADDWFYGARRNQFWPIVESVYHKELKSKLAKEKLFTELGVAISDIILQCERQRGSNLDSNLINIVFNTRAITEILEQNRIKVIFFSSRFAENLFRRQFKGIIQQHPEIGLVTLPSPSPRYATMSKSQKIEKYRSLLPKLN